MTKGIDDTLHVVYVGEYPIQQALAAEAVEALRIEGLEVTFRSVQNSVALASLPVVPGLVIVDNSDLTGLNQDFGAIRTRASGEFAPLPVLLFANPNDDVNPALGGKDTLVVAHVNNAESLATALLIHVMGGRLERV